MAINLTQIQPHKVSTDLSGYMIYVYGPGGSGKTTFGSKAEKSLLLAFEKGYNALPGVMAQDITNWSEFRQTVNQLKKPEVKQMFSTIVIDTVDIASQLCEKYMCSQLDIENIGDGGWSTNGWAKVKREWETCMRTISMEGYSLVFISHSKDKKFTRKDGTEYNQTVPSCSNAYNEIIKNMVDIQGYIDVDGGDRKLILRSGDDSVECKCRFAMIQPEIEFSYDNLVDALRDAIDKESKITKGKFVTEDKEKKTEAPKYNYTAMQEEFQALCSMLMTKDRSKFEPEIKSITAKVLGKDKKFIECNENQCELMDLILSEIRELI